MKSIAMLVVAGVLAEGTVAHAESVTMTPNQFSGSITFAGGGAIPKGHLKIYLEDGTANPIRQEVAARAQFDSTGKALEITYDLPKDALASPSGATMVVAVLERADGWLLASGMAQITPDDPTPVVTLYPVAY